MRIILLKISIFIFTLSPTTIRKIMMKIILKLDSPSLDSSRLLMKKFYGIHIGRFSYGCEKIDGSISNGTIIGSFCSIAPGVRIGGMNHPSQFVSTHPFLYYKNRGFIEDDKYGVDENGNLPVIIEDDVWLGQNVIILPGVKISKGSMVGAGAVVTNNVPPYAVVVGVPARVIKYRFSEEEIEELLKIDWANWSDSKIRRNIEGFYKVDEFIKKN